jgi:hypothetical protein
LEKIYDGHLEIALNKVRDLGLDARTTLLEGKPYNEILKYIDKVEPSLLVVGRTGIHAIDGLDLGSSTENILRYAKCNVLITKSGKSAQINPFYEKEENIKIEQPQPVNRTVNVGEFSWDDEAKSLVSRAPDFVRKMVVTEVENYARAKGSSEITREIVEEVKTKWSDSMNYS